MKVLVITGDKNFKEGNERYDLQRSVVDELSVVYWGRGSVWPKLPAGTFDVVTTQDPFWRGFFGWCAAKRKGAMCNVQVHTDLSAQSFVKHILAQIVLRHADSVRVVSEKLEEQVKKINPRVRIVVLPVFIDTARFTAVQRQPHEGKNILWIGRFEAEKDPLFAIEVLKEVRKTGVDAKLILLGNGSLKPKIVEAAKGLPVEMLGWQDPVKYLSTADMVLSTSLHESFGASMVEALAAGVPVVAPDVGVAKEAGASIAPRAELYKSVISVLHSEHKGALQLHLLTKEAWANNWKRTLN